MDEFFQASHDIYWAEDPIHSEVRLIPEKAAEFMSTNHTSSDLMDLLDEHAVAWLEEGIVITTDGENFIQNYSYDEQIFFVVYFYVEFKNSRSPDVWIASFSDLEPPSRRVYEKLIQLMAQQPAVGVFLSGNEVDAYLPLPAATLAYLLDMTSRVQQSVTLENMQLTLDQSRELAAFRGSLCLARVAMDDDGREFFQAIEENLGPEEINLLDAYHLDEQCLYRALQSTTSLKTLRISHRNQDFDFRELLQALELNVGLIEFDWYSSGGPTPYGAKWNAVLSLARHPTLKKLSFRQRFHPTEPDDEPARVKRSKVLVDLLKVNKVLCEILLPDGLVDQAIEQHEIKPRLKANKYRPIFQALAAEETDQVPRLFNMLLNPEVNDDLFMIFILLSEIPKEVLVQLTRTALHESTSVARADKRGGVKRTSAALDPN